MMQTAEQLLAERLTRLALAFAFDPAASSVVVARMVNRITGLEESDPEQTDALVSSQSATELDIALLRSLADVLEAAETQRLDNPDDGA